jgi:preprotein translocase subunit SecA
MSDDEIAHEFDLMRMSCSTEKQVKTALPRIYALIYETIIRKLGIVPYTEQVICALALFDGFVAEVKTGEGKTVSAVFAAAALSLLGKVHIVTVNDYLANRDAQNMRPVYEALGITCSANCFAHPDKKSVYSADVVYTSSHELIFDYLRDEFADHEDKVMSGLDSVIIDEIDFVLLDNANSSFSVSESKGPVYFEDAGIFAAAKEICAGFAGEETTGQASSGRLIDSPNADYMYSYDSQCAFLTERGLSKIEKIFNTDNLTTYNERLYAAVLYTLDANLFYRNGVEYIVRDNRIIYINKENGRLMPNSYREPGLQAALETKEGVPITSRRLIENTMSYQVFFSKYKRMSGMSGTIKGAQQEFKLIFNAPVLFIPTHNKNRRIDYPDIITHSLKEKYAYLVDKVRWLHARRQPVAVFAGSERESELIHEMLAKAGLESILLNSHNTDKEDEIIRHAGDAGSITVTTNMAARGTDIIIDSEAERLGGLFVISTRRYESRRIDDQIRGRAGRQGHPGATLFIVSIEDEIAKHVPQAKIRDTDISRYPLKIRRLIDSAQQRMQSDAFASRKMLYELDSVIDAIKKTVINRLDLAAAGNAKQYLYRCADIAKKYDKDDIDSRYEQLGCRIADALATEIIKQLSLFAWSSFKKDLEYFRNANSLESHYYRDMTVGFILRAFDMADAFITDLDISVLEAFLTVRQAMFGKTAIAEYRMAVNQ